jgi:hypothetical protein
VENCWYARLICLSKPWTLWGSNPDRSNSLRSFAGKAEPLLKYGVLRSAVPLSAHSTGPLVLKGRWENLDASGAMALKMTQRDRSRRPSNEMGGIGLRENSLGTESRGKDLGGMGEHFAVGRR